MSDSDDTAKGLLTLSLLGHSVNPTAMITQFESTSRFLTYPTERNPSLSANCNILDCLLHLPRPNEYNTQISKIVTFLCDTWDTGLVTDKWVCEITLSFITIQNWAYMTQNLSSFYPIMLLSQSDRV